ncbi:hypothetical protein [Pandoraea sp. NPDC090278]|uniref:hypothetical protein n=1 Tax=Pandoraea sp. NPDC090278 TaxID=3364391 RepID=UPI00383AA98D
MRIYTFVIVAALFFAPRFSSACTVREYVTQQIPLNSVAIPNSVRVEIAEMVIRARAWPGVEIRAVIGASAYVGERNPQQLVAQRTSELHAYLLQLGIKQENFWLQPYILNDQMARDANGNLDIQQLTVTLYPECEGGCERLCDDPRVVPTTKGLSVH